MPGYPLMGITATTSPRSCGNAGVCSSMQSDQHHREGLGREMSPQMVPSGVVINCKESHMKS